MNKHEPHLLLEGIFVSIPGKETRANHETTRKKIDLPNKKAYSMRFSTENEEIVLSFYAYLNGDVSTREALELRCKDGKNIRCCAHPSLTQKKEDIEAAFALRKELNRMLPDQFQIPKLMLVSSKKEIMVY